MEKKVIRILYLVKSTGFIIILIFYNFILFFYIIIYFLLFLNLFYVKSCFG